MEKTTHMYDAMWPKAKRPSGHTKAVIAARYEECFLDFNKLCASLQPHFPENNSHSLTDCLGSFIAWGNESGANGETLDYKLRNARDMHDMVLTLITQLHEVLEEGKTTRLLLLEADGLQDIATASLSEDDQKHIHEDEDVGPDDVRPEFRNQSLELIERAGDIFEVIQDIVDNLNLLAPSLARPYPEDVDALSSSVTNSSENGDQADVELARHMFPSASSILQNRLGHANWKRRLSQKVAQQRIMESGVVNKKKTRKGEKRTARQEVAQDAFNFQRPTWGIISKTPHINLPAKSVASSTTPSEAESASNVPSVFDPPRISRAGSAITMITLSSLARSSKSSGPRTQAISTAAPVSQKEIITFPKMPVKLDELREGKHELFTCNLCGYDLEAGNKIKTEDDWKQHVLQDLEPYLCTFDQCFSAQEMYAIRDEWYKHELETHRIRKVWACAACNDEFDSKKLAEHHLTADHKEDLDDDDIFMMKAMLRPTLSNKRLAKSPCPLCLHKVTPDESKDHIARHLEYFSMLSVRESESSEDDSDEIFSVTNDDNMSERGMKETVLSTFVKEQLKLNLERGTQPPDKYMPPGKGLELLDDMSDNEGSKDSGSVAGGRREESRTLLMDRMFHGEKNTNTAGGGMSARKPSHRQANATGSGSTTSNERLPLLRTWSYPRIDDFQGRDKDLARLYKILSEPGTVCVVSAEGGMGKTALAVEYSWRFEHCYHYVFWVQAETPVGSTDTFVQVALQLGLATEGTDSDTLVKMGREFLENLHDKRWLMVFDNVDKWEDIDSFVPTTTSETNGSILITTRRESLTAPSRPVNYYRWVLEELDMDEGRKLLISGLPQELRPQESSLRDPEYKIAGEIATLAGLPLLIIYISGYVRLSGCSLSEFWEYWEEWRPNARAAGSSEGRDSVFDIALRDLGGDARKVLKIMAFLDSDGIQKELLVRNDNNKPGPPYLKQNRFRLIMSNLITQKFVNETSTTKHAGNQSYTVHRVLQSRLLQDMKKKPSERDEIFGIAYELVRYHLPRPSVDTYEPAKWNTFKEYLPHVLSLQRAYADPLSITSPKPFLGLAELFKNGGILLWQRYIYNDALKLLNSAERILDELESDEVNMRAEINITITLLLQYFGITHRKESKERLGRILEYRKTQFEGKSKEDIPREDTILLIDAHADYANGLLQFNDYRAAEPIYQKCYDMYLELGAGSDPSSVFALAKLNHHMAYCKMYRKEFAAANSLAEKAVAFIQRLGDPQMTLRYQFDQACIVLQSGDKERALALHREILEQRLGLQGRASYFSLQSQYAYAALCHYLGRVDEAERWMRQALSKASERGGKNFWPEAAVARTKFHLSQLLSDKNGGVLTEEASDLARDAKDVLSKMLPFDPITGVKAEDTGALFDHLQPVFGGRWTGISLLNYVS